MNKVILFSIILIMLTGCTVPQGKPPQPDATGAVSPNMPNPAALYCEQNGYWHEIRTANDGSQSGVCVFPDGSSCDEWAYYRGECGPAASESPTPATTPALAEWWGVIKSTPPGAQFDDYFALQDGEQSLCFGIDSIDPSVQAQIKTLRDSGRTVHVYGTLLRDIPDYNGSQIQVERIEVEG